MGPSLMVKDGGGEDASDMIRTGLPGPPDSNVK